MQSHRLFPFTSSRTAILETGYQRSDASWEAAPSACTACACPRPRGASALGDCSPLLGTLRDVGQSVRSAHARTPTHAHCHGLRSAPGRIPSSLSQTDPVPLPGFLLRALGINKRWRCELLQRGQHLYFLSFPCFLSPKSFLCTD